MIRSVGNDDIETLLHIYNYYVKETCVTFQDKQLKFNDMKAHVYRVTSKYPWLVYEENGEVYGYAYAREWKERGAYKYTVESTVYFDRKYGGKGYGTKLYSELILQLKLAGVKCVIAGIALPNDSSVGLHEKLGFEHVGIFKKVGYKFDDWIDVGYWQLLL